MSLTPNELQRIQPVNQPRKDGTKPVMERKRTGRREAYDRHQRATDASGKKLNFGMKPITRDQIDEAILNGTGNYHPNNRSGQSLATLKTELEFRKSNQTTQPMPPTPFEVYGSLESGPFHFYTRVVHAIKDKLDRPLLLNADEVNSISIKGVKTSLTNLGSAVWLKIIIGRTFSRPKALGYIQYFRYLADSIEAALPNGDAFLNHHTAWDTANEKYQLAHQQYIQQETWEAHLTDIDKLTILRGEVSAEMDSKLNDILKNQELTKLKPKRKRRTNAEIAEDTANSLSKEQETS